MSVRAPLNHAHNSVEEEIGFDGAPAPYLFAKDIQLSGGSFPKPLAKLKRDFQRKLVDLWGRAGKGPVCTSLLRRV